MPSLEVKGRILVLAIVVTLGVLPIASAQVEIVTITGAGTGKTFEEAVDSALLQAISIAAGQHLASTTTVGSLRLNVDTTTNTAADLTRRDSSDESPNDERHPDESSVNLHVQGDSRIELDSTERTVSKSIDGAIKSYRILEQHQDAAGIWYVMLAADLPAYVRPTSAERVRITIAPFHLTATSFRWGGKSLAGAEVQRALAQQLSRSLVQSEKFTVLDREFGAETSQEEDLIRSGRSSTEDVARLGQQLAADYVLVGTVDDLFMRVTERQLRVGERRIRARKALARVSFRLINAATRHAIASDTLSVSLSNSDFPRGRPDTLYEVISNTVVGRILDLMYPTTLISVEGNRVVIGRGGSTISSGNLYKVFRLGDEIVDPDTSEIIGREETYCCQVRIDRVTPRFANAVLIQGPMDLAREFQPGRFVLGERIEAGRPDPSEKVSSRREAIKKERAESNDDW